MTLPIKECPDCGMLLKLDTEQFTFYCPDQECGYTEYCEDGNPAGEEQELEEDTEYHCPHCGKTIEEDDLPN